MYMGVILFGWYGYRIYHGAPHVYGGDPNSLALIRYP